MGAWGPAAQPCTPSSHLLPSFPPPALLLCQTSSSPSPQVFLTRVAAHPVLRTSKSLQIFLEMPEDQFGLEVARASLAAQAAAASSSASSGGGFAAAAASHGGGVTGAAKGALEGAVGWIKGLGSAASGLVGARGTEAAEDPEYIKVGGGGGGAWSGRGEGVQGVCVLAVAVS